MKKLLILSALLVCTAHPVSAMSRQPTPQEEAPAVSDNNTVAPARVLASEYLTYDDNKKSEYFNDRIKGFSEDQKTLGNLAASECVLKWGQENTQAKLQKLSQWAAMRPDATIKSLMLAMFKKKCSVS